MQKGATCARASVGIKLTVRACFAAHPLLVPSSAPAAATNPFAAAAAPAAPAGAAPAGAAPAAPPAPVAVGQNFTQGAAPGTWDIFVLQSNSSVSYCGYTGFGYPNRTELTSSVPSEPLAPDCAALCASNAQCQAATLLEHDVAQGGQPDCLLYEGVRPGDAYAAPQAGGKQQVLIVEGACADTQWADGGGALRTTYACSFKHFAPSMRPYSMYRLQWRA